MSFLRNQESRRLCSCWVPPGQAETLGYFLDSRLCGNDTLDVARQENDRWLIRLKCSLVFRHMGIPWFSEDE